MANAAHGNPTRRIDEGAVIGKPQTRAQRDEPIVILCKLLNDPESRQENRLAAVLAAPCDISFETPDEMPVLVVESDLEPPAKPLALFT